MMTSKTTTDNFDFGANLDGYTPTEPVAKENADGTTIIEEECCAFIENLQNQQSDKTNNEIIPELIITLLAMAAFIVAIFYFCMK